MLWIFGVKLKARHTVAQDIRALMGCAFQQQVVKLRARDHQSGVFRNRREKLDLTPVAVQPVAFDRALHHLRREFDSQLIAQQLGGRGRKHADAGVVMTWKLLRLVDAYAQIQPARFRIAQQAKRTGRATGAAPYDCYSRAIAQA